HDGKARRQRKQKRNQIETSRETREDQTDDRIDRAEEQNIATIGTEIVDALCKNVPQIGDADAADGGLGRVDRVLEKMKRKARCLNEMRGINKTGAAPFDGILDGHARSSASIGKGSLVCPGHETSRNL